MSLDVHLRTHRVRDACLAAAREAAAELVRWLGLAAPTHIDVEAIAEMLGAEVVTAPLPNALAQVVRIGRQARIRISDRIQHEGRRRFSIAHEIGHLWLGHEPVSFVELCSAIAIEGRPARMEEAAANAFASELLMPATMLTSWATLSPPEIASARQIAEVFHVSLTAATLRLVEASPYACAVTLCQGGRVRRAARSTTFPLFLPRDRMPGPDSSVIAHLAGADVPRGPRRVPASTWLGHDADPSWTLIEDAIALPITGEVMTILVIEAPETTGTANK